ncbi:hypothetical protein [Haloplanus rubicundus]|uniref:Uncharacterized protein n=1 Tax=Haloplanus rubicundus TaxID=1547898 RepID=A0A345EHJ0_9EURY|nr:hypothetical protein [Haloplanus rubicundus]AXG11662.1 hypothetical protein DU484_18370 [Haloplanus rubicundus]
MARRGSTGDDSDNDFSGVGGGSDTDTGSGVTGDDGSDTSFSGGGGGNDSSNTGGSDTGGGDTGGGVGGGDSDSDQPDSWGDGGGSDDDTSGVVGGGGDRRGSDSDTTYSGGGSDTDAGSGVTGDDGSDTTFEGGDSDQNQTQAPQGDTGTDDPDTDPDRGTSVTETPDGDTVANTGDGNVQVGDTTDRGVGVTRNPEGIETVVPAPGDSAPGRGGENEGELPMSTPAQPTDVAALGPNQQRDLQRRLSDGEIRAAVTRFGQRQLGRPTPVESPYEPVGPVDFAVDALFQDSEEVAPYFGITGAAARRDTVDLGGPTLGLDPGARDPVNTDVTDALTEGRGRFSEETVADVRRRAEGYQEFFGVGAEADRLVTELTGNAEAGNFARGLGNVPGNIAAAPSQGVLIYNTAWQVGRNLPETVDEYGAGTVADTALDTSGAILQGTTRSARRRPYQTGGNLLGEAVVGTAAVRAGGGLGTRIRSARVRRQADETVQLEDTTSERGVEGALPYFDTDTDAPTEQAVAEVRERAADNPDTVLDALYGDADRVLFHSTEADLGDEFEAARGSSELPGLFTSPDASPLRIQDSESSWLSRPEIRFPRASDFTGGSDRFAGFRGDRIEGMPDDATGARRIPDPDGGTRPDPRTSGAQFLDEAAEEGTAYVRPPGSRTEELEAIYPPGSGFQMRNRLAVELPSGRAVPLDLFERAGRTDLDTEDARTADTARQTGEEISARYSSELDESGTPVTPPLGLGGSTGTGAETELPDVEKSGGADGPDGGGETTDEPSDGLLDATPRTDAGDDGLLSVTPRDGGGSDDRGGDGADESGDGLTDSTRRDDGGDDLLGVTPRDDEGSNGSASDTPSQDDSLLGVSSPTDGADDGFLDPTPRSEDSAPAGGGTGSGAASGRDDGYFMPSLTSTLGGSGGSGGSWFGSGLSLPGSPGTPTGGSGPGSPGSPSGGSGPGSPPGPTGGTPYTPFTPPTVPNRRDRDRDRDPGFDFEIDTDRFGGATAEDDRPLSVGYYNEFIADFAFGAAPTQAPSQETLADFGGAAAFTEQLPTLRELEAEGDRRDALEAAYDTFGFSGLSVTSDGGSDDSGFL